MYMGGFTSRMQWSESKKITSLQFIVQMCLSSNCNDCVINVSTGKKHTTEGLIYIKETINRSDDWLDKTFSGRSCAISAVAEKRHLWSAHTGHW